MSGWKERLRKITGRPIQGPQDSGQNAELARSSEAQFDSFLIVAHQDVQFRSKMVEGLANMLTERMPAESGRRIGCLAVSRSYDLFAGALIGLRGIQPYLLYLGSQYIIDRDLWTVNKEMLQGFAERDCAGISSLINPKEDSALRITERLYEPSGLNFTLWLRALGFKGNIMLEQSFPELDKERTEIERRVQELRSIIPSFPEAFPVYGFFNPKQAEGRVHFN